MAQDHLGSVGSRSQTLILRVHGRVPAPGDYTVSVMVNGGSLIWQPEHVG